MGFASHICDASCFRKTKIFQIVIVFKYVSNEGDYQATPHLTTGPSIQYKAAEDSGQILTG